MRWEISWICTNTNIFFPFAIAKQRNYCFLTHEISAIPKIDIIFPHMMKGNNYI